MRNHKHLISFFYFLKGRRDLKLYKEFQDTYHTSIEVLEKEQLAQFKNLFKYCKECIPYYSKLFTSLKLNVDDFKTLKDLEKIPVLTKNQIRSNYDLFLPKNSNRKFVMGSTGGSTGKPLQYRIDIEDYSRSYALLYRGLSQGGYKIGDKMAIIAGGSLVNQKFNIIKKVQNKILNYKKISSYGIDNSILFRFQKELQLWNPKFLRGYSSSLFIFSKFLLDYKLPIPKLTAIFSTGEVLTKNQRTFIENVFKVKIFDNYGLNDGGITAFEDKNHHGFIIDTERSILEVINDSNENHFNNSGKILATSLYNFSMPFIRYDTGDFGTQIHSNDPLCSRHKLVNLGGRLTDFIEYNNKIIGSPILTVLMSKIDAIRYQIIQKKNGSIEFRIEANQNYSKSEEGFIRKSFLENMGSNENLNFVYTDTFFDSGNKHKFIIKE